MGTFAESARDSSQILVGVPVTIVVDSIADFRSGPFEGVAFVGNTTDARLRRMETLAFATSEERLLFVGFAIAVVVETVADLVKCPLPGVANLGHTILAIDY